MPRYYAKISGKFELTGFLTAENRIEAIDNLQQEGFNKSVEKHELLGSIEILQLDEAEDDTKP